MLTIDENRISSRLVYGQMPWLRDWGNLRTILLQIVQAVAHSWVRNHDKIFDFETKGRRRRCRDGRRWAL
jgi:hypothetical protein